MRARLQAAFARREVGRGRSCRPRLLTYPGLICIQSMANGEVDFCNFYKK